MLSLPIERVPMELGDSDFPATPGSGGPWSVATSGSGLFDACSNLREKLATKMGRKVADVKFANGSVNGGGKTETLGSLAGVLRLKASGEIKPGVMAKQFSQRGYRAHFAEVVVHMDTGEIRLRRMLGVFAARFIPKQKTAKGQAMGAMLWGVDSALHEDAVIDKRTGHFANHDLAEYHVPTHADIPAIEVQFLSEGTTKPIRGKSTVWANLGFAAPARLWPMRFTTQQTCAFVSKP